MIERLFFTTLMKRNGNEKISREKGFKNSLPNAKEGRSGHGM